MTQTTIENRRVRFENLPGVSKQDIAVTCEIWMDDLMRSPWATKEAMKLAAHLVNYIQAANPASLHVREIETSLQLNREEINRGLGLMRLFRFVSTFTIEKDEVRASLKLSQIQILRILEMRAKYLRLLSETSRLPASTLAST